MHTTTTPILRFGLAAAIALSLAACGGGGDSPAAPAATQATKVQLTGVAATGAAVPGAVVTATNAQGVSATATTGTDGSYTLSIADGAPFMLKVTTAAGQTLYSYAQAAGRANLTPLTTLALLQANANKPLADLAAQWASARPSADQVLEAAKKVNANLQSVMQAHGVDPTSVNIFAQEFSANHSGLDAVLDAMRVNISCSASACTQEIHGPAGDVLVNWNGNIATTGITVSWSAGGGTAGGGSSGNLTVGLGSCKAPVAGTWSLVVGTTVAGVGGVAVPEVCVDGLPGAPTSQAEFCAGEDAKNQLPQGAEVVSCSFSGNSGSITSRVASPLFTLEYTSTFTFVKR